jgi:hypothetical protein
MWFRAKVVRPTHRSTCLATNNSLSVPACLRKKPSTLKVFSTFPIRSTTPRSGASASLPSLPAMTWAVSPSPKQWAGSTTGILPSQVGQSGDLGITLHSGHPLANGFLPRTSSSGSTKDRATPPPSSTRFWMAKAGRRSSSPETADGAALGGLPPPPQRDETVWVYGAFAKWI